MTETGRMRSSVGGGPTDSEKEREVSMSLAEESSVDPVAEECEIAVPGKDRKLDSASDGTTDTL